jgi:hypothetical protein
MNLFKVAYASLLFVALCSASACRKCKKTVDTTCPYTMKWDTDHCVFDTKYGVLYNNQWVNLGYDVTNPIITNIYLGIGSGCGDWRDSLFCFIQKTDNDTIQYVHLAQLPKTNNEFCGYSTGSGRIKKNSSFDTFNYSWANIPIDYYRSRYFVLHGQINKSYDTIQARIFNDNFGPITDSCDKTFVKVR